MTDMAQPMTTLVVTTTPTTCHTCSRPIEPGQLQVTGAAAGPLCLTCGQPQEDTVSDLLRGRPCPDLEDGRS